MNHPSASSGVANTIEMVDVANFLVGIDVNPNGFHWSLFSLRFPQCVSLRSGLKRPFEPGGSTPATPRYAHASWSRDLRRRRSDGGDCLALFSVNVRSMLRFKARNTPMRACITKSRASAAPIRQPVAVCDSSRSCSAFGNFMMSSAASRRVSSSRPPGSRTGSSKVRAQAATGFNCAISYPLSGMCRALSWRSFPRLRLPRFPGRLFRFPEPLAELVQFGNLKTEIG